MSPIPNAPASDSQNDLESSTVIGPREPEAAQHALEEIQSLFARFRLETGLVQKEKSGAESDRQQLVEQLLVRQQQSALVPKIRPLHAADLAYVLEALPREQREKVWHLVAEDRRGEVMVELNEAVRTSLIAETSREALLRIAQSLEPDDLAALADELPFDIVERVRQGLTIEEREQLRHAMSYPDESVGARMDFEMVTIRDDVSLEVVLRYLRRFDELPDHTDQVFVVDRKEKLLGALPIGQLLVNEPESLVSEVMRRDILSLNARDDAYEAAQAFERYDLVSAPVVNDQGKLIGRLTVSEAVDLIREESDSEVLAQAGLREEEDLFSSVWASAKNRWLWLGLNLCTAFFASRVIGAFEGTIERVVALAALMPIVAGIAGNTGNQTMTLFIRSLALGQVNAGNLTRLLAKELSIAGLNGLVWGSVAGLFAWWLYSETGNGLLLGITMMLAILLNLLVAALIAIFVPMSLHRMGRDPALGSSVLLTFSTDSLGFLLFLGLASLFFG